MEMERLEKVEKLREKTGVTYEDAKSALEQSEWDMLDAIVILERQGKAGGPEKEKYSTADELLTQAIKEKQHSGSENAKRETRKFFSWLKDMINKGNKNYINIERHGKLLMSLPVTLFIVLLVFAFWCVMPAMVIGLFFGFRYNFSGSELGKDSFNNVMNKASEVAENLKDELKGNRE